MKNYDEFIKVKELIEIGNYKLALKKIKKLYLKEQNDRIIKFEFAKLLLLLDEIEKSRKIFMSLLNTESRYFALLQLGRLEIFAGNIDKAKEYLNNLLNTSSRIYAIIELGNIEANNGNYINAKKYFESLISIDENTKKNAFLKLLMLNIKYENYEEALIYLNELIKYNDISVNLIKQYQIYIKNKLNKLETKECIDGYINNQIVTYNHRTAKEHIKYHLEDNNEKEFHTKFLPNINIDYLFDIVNNEIKKIKKQNFGIQEKCIIDMGYIIGEYNGFETSLIEVITLCNTNNIITMYPVASKYKVYSNNYLNNKKIII